MEPASFMKSLRSFFLRLHNSQALNEKLNEFSDTHKKNNHREEIDSIFNALLFEGVKNLICPLCLAHGATVSNRLIYETIIVQLTARRERSEIARTRSLLTVSLSRSQLKLVTGIESQKCWLNQQLKSHRNRLE